MKTRKETLKQLRVYLDHLYYFGSRSGKVQLSPRALSAGLSMSAVVLIAALVPGTELATIFLAAVIVGVITFLRSPRESWEDKIARLLVEYQPHDEHRFQNLLIKIETGGFTNQLLSDWLSAEWQDEHPRVLLAAEKSLLSARRQSSGGLRCANDDVALNRNICGDCWPTFTSDAPPASVLSDLAVCGCCQEQKDCWDPVMLELFERLNIPADIHAVSAYKVFHTHALEDKRTATAIAAELAHFICQLRELGDLSEVDPSVAVLKCDNYWQRSKFY